MIEKALEQLLATLGFQNAVTLCMCPITTIPFCAANCR